MDAKALLLV